MYISESSRSRHGMLSNVTYMYMYYVPYFYYSASTKLATALKF